MKAWTSVRLATLLAFLTASIAGCSGGSTPDVGPTGESTPPVTKDMIQKVEAGRGQMGPPGSRKK